MNAIEEQLAIEREEREDAMANMMERGALANWNKIKVNGGQPVTVRRGGSSVEVALAVRGSALLQVQEGEGDEIAIHEISTTTWMIAVEDYDFGAGQVRPARDDTIEDATGVVYQLLPVSGEDAFRWADAYRNAYRCHGTEMT